MRSFLIILCFLLGGLSLSAQDTFNMSLLSTWHVDTLPTQSGFRYNDIWGYVDCQGNEYAIIGSAAYVHFINITDENNIFEVNSFAGGNLSVWRDFKTYKNYAYAVADQGGSTEGLMVFDLSYLPDSVVLVNQTNADFNRAHNIFIEEATSRLYVVGTNSSANAQGILIYDLAADPVNPSLLSSVDLTSIGGPDNSYIHDVYVRDNLAYASHVYAEQLYIYDVSDPLNITVVGSLLDYPERGLNHSSWLNEDGTQLVFADETKGSDLKIMDVSDMNNLFVAPQNLFKSQLEAEEKSIAHNPFIRDQYAFISYYHDGIQVFDISDPDNVTNVAYYDTYENTTYAGFRGVWGVYPYLPSQKIIASDITGGLFVTSLDNIDLNPIVPTLNPVAEFAQTEVALCEGDSLVVYATPGAENYNWFSGNDLLTNTNTDSIVVSTGGNYTYQANNDYCVVSSPVLEVTETATVAPTISLDFPTLMASPATTYQWFFNGSPIPGATESTLEATANGDYSVVTTDQNGCAASSEIQSVVMVGTGEIESVAQITIFPNPTVDVVQLQLVARYDTNLTIELKNVTGQVLSVERIALNGTLQHEVSFAAYPAGVYFIQLKDQDSQYIQKVIKH